MNKDIYNSFLDYGPILVVGDGIEDNYIVAKNSKSTSENIGNSILLKCFDGEVSVGYGGAGNIYENIIALGGIAEDLCPIVDRKYRIGSTAPDGKVFWNTRIDVPKPKNLQNFLTNLYDCLSHNWYGSCVIGDYNKGTITDDVIQLIANKNFKHILIDTKRDPFLFEPIIRNFGNSCAFLPNRQEYTQYIKSYHRVPMCIRTESENGVTLIKNDKVVFHSPAIVNPKYVTNVSGAGDTVTASCAVGLALKMEWPQILGMAMHSAGYVVKQNRLSVVQGGDRLVERFFGVSRKIEKPGFFEL